jgi:WD40 repeat protein
MREESQCLGDYELIEEISRGAMGVVYRARQMSLNRFVALKMILDGALASPAVVMRFQVEAEAAALLSHPNIVPVYETGELRGRRFFSMQLLEGGNLGERLNEFTLLEAGSNREAALARQRSSAQLIVMIAEAVHHAHQRGVLHRDLKPSNILLDTNRTPHVTDFGIAKMMTEESGLTDTGAHLGTPAYMAPEQAAGDQQITTATDVYGLGAILYHLLAGRPPFQGATPMDTMRQVIEREPVPPHRLNPMVQRDLSIICLKCLDKDPSRRYASALALAQDLERWLKGETITAVPATHLQHFLRWRRRNPALAILAAAVLFLVVAVAVVSTTAAFRINRASRVAIAAREEATEKLWASYLAQARAQRWSGKPGRRFDSLQAIASAAAIRPSLELRNEAIADMALADIRAITNAPKTSGDNERILLDAPHNHYVLGERDGTIHLLRLDNHTELSRLPKLGGGVAWFGQFSPDGRFLSVQYNEGFACVWNLMDGSVISRFASTSGIMLNADFSRVAVGSASGDVAIYQVSNSSVPSVKINLPIVPVFLIWNPNEKTLAAADGLRILILDATTGTVIRNIDMTNQFLSVAWHPDGIRMAVASVSQRVEIINTANGEHLPPLAGHQGSVTSVCFSPNGRMLASCSWDGKLRLWNFATGREIINIQAGYENVYFSPDSQRLTVYGESQTHVDMFELALNEVQGNLGEQNARYQPSDDAVLFAKSGQWLSTSENDTLTLWQPETLTPLVQVTNLPSAIIVETTAGLFSWNAGGMFVLPLTKTNGVFAAARPQRFHPQIPTAWLNLAEEGLWNRFTNNVPPARAAASRDGNILAVTYDSNCYVFDMTAKRLQAVTKEQYLMKFVTVDPDGQWVATGGWNNRNALIWDAVTGLQKKELPTGFSPVVAASPDGKWLVTGTGLEYCFWRTSDWALDHRILRPGHEGLSGQIVFSGDGKIVALSDTRSSLRLVSAQTGETLALIEPTPELEIDYLALNFDGSELAVSRLGVPPQVWHLNRIRQQLAAIKLDW